MFRTVFAACLVIGLLASSAAVQEQQQAQPDKSATQKGWKQRKTVSIGNPLSSGEIRTFVHSPS